MKKNQRLFIIYSTLIIISQVPHTSHGAAGEKAAEKVYKAAETLSAGLKNVDTAAKKLDDAAKSLEKASPLFGSKAAETVAEVVKPIVPIAQACGIVYLGYKAWSAYDYFFPSDDARRAAEAQSLKVQRELKYLKAKQSFENCLLNNADTHKNSEGLPSICEKTAQTFAIVAGHDETKNIKMAFKECFK